MAPLEDQLTSRDRSDYPKTGKRRALGKWPWPRCCAVGGSNQCRVAGHTRTREGSVQCFAQTAPDIVGPRRNDGRVLIEVRQRSNLHQSLRGVPIAVGKLVVRCVVEIMLQRGDPVHDAPALMFAVTAWSCPVRSARISMTVVIQRVFCCSNMRPPNSVRYGPMVAAPVGRSPS